MKHSGVAGIRLSSFVVIGHSSLVIIFLLSLFLEEKRTWHLNFDILLYESERKRSYEGRTASSAAISARRRRHWLNWARAVSSSKTKSFHGNEPDMEPDEA